MLPKNMANTPPLSPPSQPSEHWLLWQLADSAFPIGGFAHSSGLEAAWQHDYLCSPYDLHEFAHQSLQQTLHAALPFLLAAFDEMQTPDHLDALFDATLSNHVANRASRAQGHALLATMEKTFPTPALTAWRSEVLKHHQPGHLPVVAGVILRMIGIARENAVRLFVYLHCRGLLSAAVRLGVVGPIQAQQIQARLAPQLDAVALAAATLTLADVTQTSPFLDILQSTQDRLYSRLFQS
jgi:urease accessory protein